MVKVRLSLAVGVGTGSGVGVSLALREDQGRGVADIVAAERGGVAKDMPLVPMQGEEYAVNVCGFMYVYIEAAGLPDAASAPPR